MSKFQVVNIKDLQGNAKASGKPYKMRIVGGLFTGDDGVVEMGEIIFMEGADRPLPMHLQAGQAYTPVVGASSRDGKLQFQITELRAIHTAAKPASVAA